MERQQDLRYTYWRKDKPKEPGFSHELISSFTECILDQTDLDSLDAQPFPGVNTLRKAMQRNCQIRPHLDFLGTRNKDKYEWMTYKTMVDTAECLSHGYMALGLCP